MWKTKYIVMYPTSKLIFNLDAYLKDPAIHQKDYHLSRPKPIGCFSLSSDRLYSSDTSELKFLVMPDKNSFPLDLNKQSTKHDEHNIYDEYLDNMLHFIRDNPDRMFKKTAAGRFVVNADIVTHCELLQVLKCTIYAKHSWRIFGTKYRNTIYLCLAKLPLVAMSMGAWQKQRTCQMWDRKLKICLCSDIPGNQQLELEREGGEFHSVFQSYMGELSVVYGSEMGAHHGNLRKITGKHFSMFAECKVIPPRSANNDNSDLSESELALLWWSKCSLIGVEEIYVARPKTSGQIEAIEIKHIVPLLQKNSKNWSSDRCNIFMIYILQQIRSEMKLDNPNAIYQFDYDCNSGDLKYEACNQRNENTFIADWFRYMLNTINSRTDYTQKTE